MGCISSPASASTAAATSSWRRCWPLTRFLGAPPRRLGASTGGSAGGSDLLGIIPLVRAFRSSTLSSSSSQHLGNNSAVINFVEDWVELS